MLRYNTLNNYTTLPSRKSLTRTGSVFSYPFRVVKETADCIFFLLTSTDTQSLSSIITVTVSHICTFSLLEILVQA